ncbi:ATP-binding protein [Sedimentitalea nanhaiensis]|uniref:histidine kinase n=1 Tax=Sedimentitalea nanhaiensis TaxID=999627 RepID=A0A1I6XZ95_9RHOB|nr:ATP-binding protein [Sedimentitalea nanhaiensis]SFT43679.1 two-component system, OmpR family, osmolarity sensor histidine kinase EnvZ [Sedimentitalea nanhaiensis]
MFFQWLKHYMPRSLYGRAALILIVPVVSVQLVVSIAFVQKHLENVTTQMSETLLRELDVIASQMVQATTTDEALIQMQPYMSAFQMDVTFVSEAEVPAKDYLRWYDFSAGIVRDTVRAEVPSTLATAFPDNRSVQLYLDSHLGPTRISFARGRVAVTNPHQLIVTMAFFGALMTVIAFLYMRNQLRPITRLADAAQAFGRGRTVPYTPSGATEVRAAGGAFLDMRARIERQIEQRTLMLSGVSHDLRTPLTRLRLGLAMIDEDDAEPLLRDVDEMQRLLDAFLDFSSGLAEGDPEEVDPLEFVRLIVEDAQRAGNPIELTQASGEGTIMLRPVAIRRALENLLNNAVRYGTRAEVSVVLSEKSLRIRVEDDGPGIPIDRRGESIKPFARLDPARNQDKGSGVGLGLAIVTDVARAHGGVLRLGESETLGGLSADIVIAR